MKTILLNNDITPAVEELKRRGIVAFPTETVYGLGGCAFCGDSARKIFAAKGRPSDNPLIVHCADETQVRSVVRGWNEAVERLAEAFWPGPLTLVLPKGELIPDEVTGGLETVGVRIPDHPLALRLIEEAGFPLAAPSANRSGRPSPTRAADVLRDLQGKVPYIIDGGDAVYGLESTVLDCTNSPFRILRPGFVTKGALEGVLGENVAIEMGVLTGVSGRVASPGMKYRHYAPESYQLILVDGGDEFLENLYDRYTNDGKRVMILTMGRDHFPGKSTAKLGEDLRQVGENLYRTLIDLEGETDIALCRVMQPEGVGLAVMNRLLRAAGFIIEKEGD